MIQYLKCKNTQRKTRLPLLYTLHDDDKAYTSLLKNPDMMPINHCNRVKELEVFIIVIAILSVLTKAYWRSALNVPELTQMDLLLGLFYGQSFIPPLPTSPEELKAWVQIQRCKQPSRCKNFFVY